MIDQTLIEELKIRNNIEDVVSSYVHLQRAGKNLKGLCPFHSEKTPSFTVHSAEGFFYCFGCGAGGDVITFVMKAENLTYPEALEFLADRAGMKLPDFDGRGAGQSGPSRAEIASMNREAAKYFHACLLDPKTPDGLNYFTKVRGYTMPLIKHFGLGYAPDGWDGLRNHMIAKGYSPEQLHAAGLLSKSEKKNSYYDFFRDRAMVPIIDPSGNIIAFGGRRIHDDKSPQKYLNTVETAAFRKSRSLFALNFAKDHCAERMILCEGYMDVMSLHGAGFPYAVATLGTAITPEHARVMSKYTKSVIICYDADEAGQRAADKAFAALAEVGLDARLLKVENAKDPDEYIKKFGKEAFARLLDGCKSRFEFKLDQILAKYDLNSMDDRIRASDECAKLIAQFSSAVERELYVAAVSAKLSVPPESLKADVEKQIRIDRRKEKNGQSDAVLRQTQGLGDRVNPQIIGNVAAARAEEAILGLMMLKKDIADRVVSENDLKEEDFVTEFNRRIFRELRALVQNGGSADPMQLADRLTPEESGRLIRMKMTRMELRDNSYAVLTECVARLRSGAKTGDTEEDILAILDKKRKKNG